MLDRKEYDKRYYEKNKTKQRERNRQTLKRNQKVVYEYLKGKSCVDCLITNPVVLTFDPLYRTKNDRKNVRVDE